jgi:hypothetical protein
MIWDTDRIQTLFDEETAAKILQVPISRHGGEDFVSWPYTKNGAYSVRSAYHLARTEAVYLARSMPKQGLSSTREDEAPLWKKLWAIKAPGKMKITLWRFIHDCLPYDHQLKHRHIPASDACVYCGRVEYVVHTMMFCEFAMDVWNELKASFLIKLQRKNFINPKAWTFYFISRTDRRENMLLAVAFWHLWNARNGVRNGDHMKSPRELAEQIKGYVDMIELHLYKPLSNHSRDSKSSVAIWSPPPEGKVQINVDAAIFKTSKRTGVGVVIRNHRGICLAACSELIQDVTTPELAEALAIRRALALTRE